MPGNPCRVTAFAGATKAAPKAGRVTQCYTWLAGDGVAQVRCWTASGIPIELCGHGLLSCGTFWSQTNTPVNTLNMNGTTAMFARRDSISWLGLPPLNAVSCAVPAWAATVFGCQPQSAAIAGDVNGYLVLVWPQGFNLLTLPVPDADLKQHTPRAIIATCIDATDSAFDICLRYFAPQHGVAEDIATGSAMRVLAEYWQKKGLGDTLRARQCSQVGGQLMSQVEAGTTWVGGAVISAAAGDINAS